MGTRISFRQLIKAKKVEVEGWLKEGEIIVNDRGEDWIKVVRVDSVNGVVNKVSPVTEELVKALRSKVYEIEDRVVKLEKVPRMSPPVNAHRQAFKVREASEFSSEQISQMPLYTKEGVYEVGTLLRYLSPQKAWQVIEITEG